MTSRSPPPSQLYRFVDRILARAAIVIQQNYRGRIGRHDAAAIARVRDTERHVRIQRHDNGIFLRALGRMHRAGQHELMGSLADWGMHPETYNLEHKELVEELQQDFETAVQQIRTEFEIYARTNFDPREEAWKIRQELRHQDKLVHEMEAHPRKGNAVRIIAKDHPARGQTGYVLRIEQTGERYSGIGEQATLKLDNDGSFEFINLKTKATATEDPMNALIIVPNLQVKIIDAEAVRNNKHAILLKAQLMKLQRQQGIGGFWWSEEETEERARFSSSSFGVHTQLTRTYPYPTTLHRIAPHPTQPLTAAVRMQKMYRGRRDRRFAQEFAKSEAELKREMHELWLQRLTNIGSATARTGRILVALGITEERFVPEMVETDLVPQAVQQAIVGAYQWLGKHRAEEVAMHSRQKVVERIAFDFGSAGEDMVRWRIRTTQARFWAAFNEFVGENVTTPLAQYLMEKGQEAEVGTAANKYYPMAAAIIGGEEYIFNDVQRSTWIGSYKFEQFADSPFVDASGAAIFHGRWEDGHPDGEGLVIFLKDPDAPYNFGDPSSLEAPKGGDKGLDGGEAGGGDAAQSTGNASSSSETAITGQDPEVLEPQQKYNKMYSLVGKFREGKLKVGEYVFIRFRDDSTYEGIFHGVPTKDDPHPMVKVPSKLAKTRTELVKTERLYSVPETANLDRVLSRPRYEYETRRKLHRPKKKKKVDKDIAAVLGIGDDDDDDDDDDDEEEDGDGKGVQSSDDRRANEWLVFWVPCWLRCILPCTELIIDTIAPPPTHPPSPHP